MRSPEHRISQHKVHYNDSTINNKNNNKTRQQFDYDSPSHYLPENAFTVLPSNDNYPPPDPPMAPQPYRLTPSSKRHKNLSFAILAETGSRPGSRSPSPTSGRVSPFRGRGFNPAGSRHASPSPSPPPPHDDHGRRSKIPKLTRRGSASLFGEKVDHHASSPRKKRKPPLNSQLSQSLTEISTAASTSRKPPPSPLRRSQPPGKPTAFQRLSPIVGSSPEPSQSQSSPKISYSQPHSRLSSPVRASQGARRATSKPPSRNTSREPSPSKSPTKIPVVKSHFRNVQAKVNSFNRPNKPKVPPKPQVLDESHNNSNSPLGTKRVLQRKDSVNQNRSKLTGNTPRTNNSKNSSNSSKSGASNNNNSATNNNSNTSTSKDVGNKRSSRENLSTVTSNSNNTKPKQIETNPKVTQIDSVAPSDDNTKNSTEASASTSTITNPNDTTTKATDNKPNKPQDFQPSTTTVVSSTTSTVTQPLKIEAALPEMSTNKPEIAPMVDGRVLSATSVSHAMNKMNDSILDTQTLYKEHGLPASNKLSPAASSIVTLANSASGPNPALDTKNATTALPTVETVKVKMIDGIVPARILDQHVQNNMSRLISPDQGNGGLVHNSVRDMNDRIKEARTVVAHDVKPIRITVREKPIDVDVQSGNIRFDTTNGLNERPGLPPVNQAPNNNESAQSPAQEQPSVQGNALSRFFATCKNKLTWKKKSETSEHKDSSDKIEGKTTSKEGLVDQDQLKQDKETSKGCFSCIKKNKDKKPDVTIKIEEEEPDTPKKWWDPLKCCGKNKVGDNSCFSTGKRKGSWGERNDSILSSQPSTDNPQKQQCCRNLFRKMFCLHRCAKKPVRNNSIRVEDASRRASMVSSKKKSLTPSIPPEESKPKIDISLVEHTSHMKGAIPVLPVSLAWFCLVMNCIAPGTGTVFSGLFCLCIGKPRFSQKDGPRDRIGAFIINLVIGFGQCFTVLFCLVGWGWSIWWGIIMLRVAKKHEKIKKLEENAQAPPEPTGQKHNHHGSHRTRDPEKGS